MYTADYNRRTPLRSTFLCQTVLEWFRDIKAKQKTTARKTIVDLSLPFCGTFIKELQINWTQVTAPKRELVVSLSQCMCVCVCVCVCVPVDQARTPEVSP